MSKFLVYKASAGSGKTYTLVKEYLKIVLKNPDDFRHVLAITFTNKAADEMKERIILYLTELSEGKNPHFEKALIKEGVKTDIKHNASIVLKSILHKYYYFSVFTIDSFFQRIIRSFAKELNLHLSYTLEIDSDDVMNKITDELLDEIGQDKQLTEYLESYVFQNIDEDKGWKIDDKIKEVGNEIFKERYWELKKQFDEGILDKEKIQKIINELRKVVGDFEDKMYEISVKAQQVLDKFNLFVGDFFNKERGVLGYLINNIGTKKKYNPTKTAYNARDNKSYWYSKNSDNIKNINQALDDGLFKLLNKAITLWESDGYGYNTANVLLDNIQVLGVFKDLFDKLKNYRDENKLMLLTDANNILQEIIKDMAGVPFVYEKIGNQYKYYLIDEFQDTSTFQWNNLLPLIENSLSEDNLSLLVGDVKQSIYRWRNGNMRLLLEKIYHDLASFEQVIKNRTLANNHRSRINIVEFNNRLFSLAPPFIKENILKREITILNKAYEDCIQNPDADKKGGYINIEFIPYDKESEIKPCQITIERVVDIVESLKAEKIPLKDILILTRKNIEASDISKVLTANDIPVVSDDSLFLYNSPKVKLLLSLLKYVVDKNNLIAKTEALYHYKLIQNGEMDFDKIFSDNIISKGSFFNESIPENFFGVNQEKNNAKDYKKLNSALNNFSLYELTETLIQIFNLSGKPDLYLMRFMDLILEYSGKYTSDITGFIEWWEKNKEKYSIVVPEEAEAVRIMTIHSAKGLQSPIVILPFVNWSIGPDNRRSTMWVATDEEEPFNETPFLVNVSKSLEKTYFEHEFIMEQELTCLDNLNLLYVAFTRPEERLYAVVAERGNNSLHIGKMLQQIIESDEKFKTSYNIGNNRFIIGEKNTLSSQKKTINSVPIHKFISNDLYQRIVIQRKHENLKLVKDKDFSDKTQWGNLVHEALSHIDILDDVNTAIEVMKNKGLITAGDSPMLLNKIKEILSLEEVKPWFSGDFEIKKEKNILLTKGKITRPDRVLIKDDKAIVIDYKTGMEKDDHVKQVNSYADALKNMGYKSVDKFILYVEDNIVKKI